MRKMTIEEAAKFFNISKEAIHNRIRRGSLESVVENGVKYALIDEKAPPQRRKTTAHTISDAFSDYLQQQNKELLEQITKLQNETKRLREEKEQLLIEERKRIEQIYKEKDEQLKNILNAISSKFLLEAKPLDPIPQEEEHIDVEVAPTLSKKKKTKKIALKKYLQKEGLKKKKRKKLLKKITEKAKNDPRFFIKKGEIYLDPTTFEYNDLTA